MAGKHGGKRIGAGRPRKAADAERKSIKDQINELVEPRLAELVGALFALALGVPVLDPEAEADGGERVYREPPDRASAEYLINRVAGKPTESLKQEHAGALKVIVEYGDVGDPADPAPPARGPARDP